jgi:DNA replicative helicase MCM subunit Mcm2 (Cdc46/Mcm family)
MFDKPTVIAKEEIGIRILGIYLPSNSAGLSWTQAYSDPEFRWSTTNLPISKDRFSFDNAATMLGRTHIKDAETGEYLNLNVLDTDCEKVRSRLNIPLSDLLADSFWEWRTDKVVDLLKSFLASSGVVNGYYNQTLLDILTKSTFITKTRKVCGYHIYWLSRAQRAHIGSKDCLAGCEFEIKTDDKLGLCTLPGSGHKDDLNFRYTAIGRTDCILANDILYDLFVEMFKDCLSNNRLDDNPEQEQEQKPQQNKKHLIEIKNPITLSPSIVQATAGYMSGFIKKGYRHFFDLQFGGMMFHARISYRSAAQVIAALSAKISDEESESRQITLEDTYQKGLEGEEIQGAPTLAELIASKVSGQDIASATSLLDNLKYMWRMDRKASRQRQESKLVKMSIAEAKRAQSGYVQVRGSIVAMSTVYQMFKAAHVTCDDCDYVEDITYDVPLYRPHVRPRFKCPNYSRDHAKGDTAIAEYEHVPTVDVWLQDLEKSNDLNRLQVKLFDNNTYVNTGEIVDAVGHIHVVRSNDNINSKPESVLFSDELIYIKRKEITLTEKDKQNIRVWKTDLEKNGKNIIDESVKLFAPHLMGYDHIKKGIFIQCVNAGIKNDRTRLPIRMKLNILLIGDPGTAKGEISSAAIELIPNCQSVNGIASSGVSLVAVVNKDNGGAFSVNLGPLALAKDGLCRINEIGRLKLDQQPHLFDGMEEGVTDMVKYGFPANIECYASVLATANPLNNKWKSKDKISAEEFPVLLQILHRFDLIYVFRERRDDVFIDNYVDARSVVSDNYRNNVYAGDLEKLQKYLAYCRTFEPTISDDVRMLLKHFFKHVASLIHSSEYLLE